MLLVILIMGRMIPDLFLHMGGTHVHHLNYGIFLLCTVAGILLFFQVSDANGGGARWPTVSASPLPLMNSACGCTSAAATGSAPASMRSSSSRSLFGMIAFAPPIQRLRAHHWITGAVALVAIVVFYIMLFKSLDYASKKVGPRLEHLEEQGPQ